MENTFDIRCPDFDEMNEMSDNSLNISKTSKRNYSHPVDEKIIKALDSPAVNFTLRPIVDMIADYFQGQVVAQSIPVNEKSFPEVNEIVNECVATLGIRKPYVVIDNNTAFNAVTFGTDEEPFIVIGATLVRVMNRKQLQFVIGHECGHIAMGHTMYHMLISSANLLTNMIPVVGKILNSSVGLLLHAWHRRSEVSADRAGLLCCGDLETAQKGLLQLETGFLSVDNVDLDSYLSNSRKYRNRSFLRRVNEYTADHPMISKRIEALSMFANSQKYCRVTGKTPTAELMDDKQLESNIEKLLKVM